LGFVRTLTDARRRIEECVTRLRAYLDAQGSRGCELGVGSALDRRPLELDSLACCVATYCEALSLVRERFWTTTFLDSGFWTDDDTAARADINGWNGVMTRTLAAANTRPRRIFLIDLSPAEYADAEKERRIHLRRTRKSDELNQLKAKRSRLRQNIHRMLDDGCEVKVAFDQHAHYKTFRDQVPFDYWDSELAIYDDFRVDVFGGGRTGVINRVRSYSPMLQNFPQYLAAATRYFEQLWQSGEDITKFLKRLERAEQVAEQRIDYQPNWLARYEFGLNATDEHLKTLELDKVKSVLAKRQNSGSIRHYLDIGTCTARYPIQLSRVLPADVEIIGIDDDPDCVQFARANVAEHCPSIEHIRIEHEDFTEAELTSSSIDRQFDLITCMLGTLSHFGRGRGDDFEDSLQSALRRMFDILAEDGLLLIGTWSDEACKNRDMLKIYSDDDCRLLAEWTPTRQELKARLPLAGLQGRRSSIELRLDVWICQKEGRPVSLSTIPPLG